MGISVYPPASGGTVSKNYKEQIFNASGTWTYPSSSNFDGTVEITCVGGGGAGGGFRNSSGTSTGGITGGGGGGRVILNQKVSVLNLGNQTVTVGAGGVSNWASGFGSSSGRYSTFGSVEIANYYPDPNMRWGMWHNSNNSPRLYAESSYNSNVSLNHQWTAPISIDSSYNTNYGAKSGGLGNGSAISGITNDGITPYTTLFQVPASTTFKLMFYYTWMGASSANTITPTIQWYDSDNLNISSSSLTTFTGVTSGTTFTLYTSGTFTSPSTAVWARIQFQNGGGIGYNGVTLTPNSLGLSTPVTGNTSGYQWGGSVDGSVTVRTNTSNLSNFVIAQGGGGGCGIGTYASSSLLAGNGGLYGWTQGGYAIAASTSSLNSNEWEFGSSGGGAGGSATDPTFEGAYTATSATTYFANSGSPAQWSTMFASQISQCGTLVTMDNIAYYGGGLASYPMYYYSPVTNYYMWKYGSFGGEGVQGYGAGGNARIRTGASNTSVTQRGWHKGKGLKGISAKPSVTGGGSMSKIDVTANTGQGGIGTYMNGQSETSEGQNGSSGLVIVRWYE